MSIRRGATDRLVTVHLPRVPPAVRLATAAVALVAATVATTLLVVHPTSTGPPSAPADTEHAVVLPRPEGRPVLAAPARDGNLELRPLSVECGMPAVFGTHAEAPADGGFCRVDVDARNAGTETHVLDTTRQHLVDASGHLHRPDPTAMAVRRQADRLPLGGHQRLWLELWFDLPVDAHAVAVRLSGDRDPAAYQGAHPAAHVDGGLLFPLPL